MKKAIVLLSGGIDSATTLYVAKKKGFAPSALIFDYGQRQRKEIESAKKIAKKARCPYRIVRLPFFWKGSSLLDSKVPVPVNRSFNSIGRGIPSTYVPARNLVFLCIAASFAESTRTRAIFIGAHTQDFSGYPDCRKVFFEAFKKVLTAGTKDGSKIEVFTPLIDKNKEEIIKIGLRLNVPYRMTWSCYKGGKRPCGICDSCIIRARGFKEAGIADPYFGSS
ncbi:MAG: 7-cyano-7-deazaguanine synthase QueC [Omnitrophica bacterium RBG_13_46_9]|nr:MAG: 7-cyano-7-deazaguanine synthase QueC [Omnitrophica bacterium RBG_13_46_9]